MTLSKAGEKLFDREWNALIRKYGIAETCTKRM